MPFFYVQIFSFAEAFSRYCNLELGSVFLVCTRDADRMAQCSVVVSSSRMSASFPCKKRELLKHTSSEDQSEVSIRNGVITVENRMLGI